jgi:hypothetical protein
MISVKRIFVAGVVSLFIVLYSSYTGKAALQALDYGNELECAQGLKEYLEANKTQLNIQGLSIDNGLLNVNIGCYVDVDIKRICEAISNYYHSHQECERLSTFTVNITRCSQDVYTLGFKGTMGDPDKWFKYILLKIKTKILEMVIPAEARELGVKVIGLRADVKWDDTGNLFLQVSGEVSALKGSASQVKQTVIDLLKKYTGVLNIQADNLKERSAQR